MKGNLIRQNLIGKITTSLISTVYYNNVHGATNIYIPALSSTSYVLLVGMFSGEGPTELRNKIKKNASDLTSPDSPGSRLTVHSLGGDTISGYVMADTISTSQSATYQTVTSRGTSTSDGTSYKHAQGHDGFANPKIAALQMTVGDGLLQAPQITNQTAVVDAGTVNYTNGAIDVGLDATITPTSATSTIMIAIQINSSKSGDCTGLVIERDGTPIIQGDANGSKQRCAAGNTTPNWTSSHVIYSVVAGSTSSTTFSAKPLFVNNVASQEYLNREATDTDDTTSRRATSQISVWEMTTLA